MLGFGVEGFGFAHLHALSGLWGSTRTYSLPKSNFGQSYSQGRLAALPGNIRQQNIYYLPFQYRSSRQCPASTPVLTTGTLSGKWLWNHAFAVTGVNRLAADKEVEIALLGVCARVQRDSLKGLCVCGV